MSQASNIMQQLWEYNLLEPEQGYFDIANIDPGQVQSSIARKLGLEPEDIPSYLFQVPDMSFLKQGVGKTYSPLVEAKGKTLLSGLTDSLYGKGGKMAAGGLAPGSRSWGRHKDKAKDVYGGAFTDFLTGVNQSRTAGLQNVQDMINKWIETGLEVKHGN